MAELSYSGPSRAAKRLRALAARVERSLPAAVAAGLAVLEDAVKAEAPVGPTGELRHDVEATRPVVHGRSAEGEVHVEKKDAEAAEWHAAFQEFGTSRMAANPFMSRGFEAGRRRAVKAATAVIKGGLR